MQEKVLRDNDSPISEHQQHFGLAKRPLFTLGWDMVLAEEGSLPAKHACDDLSSIEKTGNDNRCIPGHPRGGGDTAPPSLLQTECIWQLPPPSATRADEMPPPQLAAPDASPPAWISVFFDEDGREEVLRDGQTVILQEVFPGIGSKCGSRAQKATAAIWGRASPEENKMHHNVIAQDDSMRCGSEQVPKHATPIAHSAAMVKDEEEKEEGRKPPLPQMARDVFSWQEIMRISEEEMRGGNGGVKAAVKERQQGVRPSGLRHHECHSSELRSAQSRHRIEPLDGRQPPAVSPPPLAFTQPQEELTSAAADAVQSMQRTADELAHRLLMAEHEFAEERAECAVVREDVVRAIEAVERPLQEKIRVLRDLRTENEHLRQLLGC